MAFGLGAVRARKINDRGTDKHLHSPASRMSQGRHHFAKLALTAHNVRLEWDGSRVQASHQAVGENSSLSRLGLMLCATWP